MIRQWFEALTVLLEIWSDLWAVGNGLAAMH